MAGAAGGGGGFGDDFEVGEFGFRFGDGHGLAADSAFGGSAGEFVGDDEGFSAGGAGKFYGHARTFFGFAGFGFFLRLER